MLGRTRGEQPFPKFGGLSDFAGSWPARGGLRFDRLELQRLLPPRGGSMLPNTIDEAVVRGLDQKGSQLSRRTKLQIAAAKAAQRVAPHRLYDVDRIKLGLQLTRQHAASEFTAGAPRNGSSSTS